MIEVEVKLNGLSPLALIRISNVKMHSDGTSDYVAELVVERGQALGIHSRVIAHYPRKTYNVLGLLKAVMDSLTEEEMRLKGGYSPTPHISWRELGG